MEKEREKKDTKGKETVLKAEPVPVESMDSLFQNSGSHHSIADFQNSKAFESISPQVFEQMLKYFHAKGEYTDLTVVGLNESGTLSSKDITISTTSHTSSSRSKELEESWVLVEQTGEAQEWVDKNTKGFFDDWPAFGVYQQMSVVLETTGSAFMFGYQTGCASVINALIRTAEKYPGIVLGLTATTAIFSTVSPLVLNAVKYIIIGGVASGAIIATPVFVVGSGTILVSASVYQAYQLAKRTITINLEPKLIGQ